MKAGGLFISRKLYKRGGGAEKSRGCDLCSDNVLPKACRVLGQTPQFEAISKEVTSN